MENEDSGSKASHSNRREFLKISGITMVSAGLLVVVARIMMPIHQINFQD
jgi:hypothetical protein